MHCCSGGCGQLPSKHCQSSLRKRVSGCWVLPTLTLLCLCTTSWRTRLWWTALYPTSRRGTGTEQHLYHIRPIILFNRTHSCPAVQGSTITIFHHFDCPAVTSNRRAPLCSAFMFVWCMSNVYADFCPLLYSANACRVDYVCFKSRIALILCSCVVIAAAILAIILQHHLDPAVYGSGLTDAWPEGIARLQKCCSALWVTSCGTSGHDDG